MKCSGGVSAGYGGAPGSVGSGRTPGQATPAPGGAPADLVTVTDPVKLEEYLSGAGSSLGAAEVLAADDEGVITLEGDDRSRVVILRFASKEAALEWYNSEEYGKVKPLRLDATQDGWLGIATAFG